MLVCVSKHMWVQVPLASRRECCIPWSWSYRWLCNVSIGNQTGALWETITSFFPHWVTHPVLKGDIFNVLFLILRSARWLRGYWPFHQAWYLEVDPWGPYSRGRELRSASFPLAFPCVFVTPYLVVYIQHINVKCLEENQTKKKIQNTKLKIDTQITDTVILNHRTYLRAQNFQFHLGHYCYCLLANSWLAMNQQAMDNWDPQHLEDLGGWNRNEMEISLWGSVREFDIFLTRDKG